MHTINTSYSTNNALSHWRSTQLSIYRFSKKRCSTHLALYMMNSSKKYNYLFGFYVIALSRNATTCSWWSMRTYLSSICNITAIDTLVTQWTPGALIWFSWYNCNMIRVIRHNVLSLRKIDMIWNGYECFIIEYVLIIWITFRYQIWSKWMLIYSTGGRQLYHIGYCEGAILHKWLMIVDQKNNREL